MMMKRIVCIEDVKIRRNEKNGMHAREKKKKKKQARREMRNECIKRRQRKKVLSAQKQQIAEIQ
jgi:hypothetical protein